MEWLTLLPFLAAMAILMVGSAFFSASEAALFYLRERDVRQLAKGNARQALAAQLLSSPERVLSAILFWNLFLNMATFAITSMVSLRLEKSGQTAAAVGFSVLSVLAIIFFAEMVPKSVAVLTPKWFAGVCARPIWWAARIVDPLLPVLNAANLLSIRLLWPSFKPEPYLALSDLERAIQLSGTDATLEPREQRTLENIVSLADQRVDEWMKPVSSLAIVSPPVTLEQLRERRIKSSYVLISDVEGDDVGKSLWLPGLTSGWKKPLDLLADPIIYVPWCTTVAAVMEKLAKQNLQVAAVVNEHGQTIGVATLDDILDTIFTMAGARDAETANVEEPSIRQVEEGTWLVTGITSLRMLSRELAVSLPESRNVTVRGVIQEVLQRLAKPGDRCIWGSLEFVVTDAPHRGRMRVQVRMHTAEER